MRKPLMSDDIPMKFGVPWITLYVAAGFAMVYAYIVFFIVGIMEPGHFGRHVFDAWYLSVMDGRMDLPARVIRFEGSYSEDGQAFLYQGMGPLLTRFVIGPFVDLSQVSLAGISILFWTVLGTVLFQLALVRAAVASWAPHEGAGTIGYVLLTVALWLGGPGLFLVSNISHYHEPIAVSYAAAGLFLLCWAGVIQQRWLMRRALVPLALAAVLAMHARPEVGVGLTLGVLIAVLGAWRADRGGAILAICGAFVVLAIGGIAMLAVNELRFGSWFGPAGDSPRVYGNLFWGIEAPDSARMAAFEAHGTFNLLRALPNILFYTFSPPKLFFPEAYNTAETLYQSVTMPVLGFIRVEWFAGGALFLWMTWALLGVRALRAPWDVVRAHLGLVLATGAAALLLVSYGTVTSRYIVSIWPLFAALALMGLSVPLRAASGTGPARRAAVLLIVATVLSAQWNWTTAKTYRNLLTEQPGSYFQVWTPEFCQQLATRKGFDAARTAEICRKPFTAGPEGA